MASLTAKAARLPLLRVEDRGAVVSSILDYRYSDFYKEAVRNVIRNFDHVEPGRRSQVARHVQYHQDWDGLTDDLIPDLVCKADTLTQSERRDLVDASIDVRDVSSRLCAFNAWADKAHCLEGYKKREILASLSRDSEGYGQVLAAFVENADKLTVENRSDLVQLVGALDPDNAYRPAALCQLARHAEVLDEGDRSTVVGHVLAERSALPAPVLEDQLSHTQSDFSRLEALYHLGGHRFFSRGDSEAIATAIRQNGWAVEVLAHPHPLSRSTPSNEGHLRTPGATSSRDDRSRDVSNLR
jgi:hypothetical protein